MSYVLIARSPASSSVGQSADAAGARIKAALMQMRFSVGIAVKRLREMRHTPRRVPSVSITPSYPSAEVSSFRTAFSEDCIGDMGEFRGG